MNGHRVAINAPRRAGQATLIGLLVAMLLVGILAGIFYPRIAGRSEYSASGKVVGPATPIDRADDTACTIYMEQVSQAAFMYRQDHGTPPPDLEALKPYGVDQQIIDTPNCNFGLPKSAPAAPAQAGAAQPYNAYGNSSYGQPSAPPAAQPGPQAAPGTTVVGGIRVPTTAAGNDLGNSSGQ